MIHNALIYYPASHKTNRCVSRRTSMEAGLTILSVQERAQVVSCRDKGDALTAVSADAWPHVDPAQIARSSMHMCAHFRDSAHMLVNCEHNRRAHASVRKQENCAHARRS